MQDTDTLTETPAIRASRRVVTLAGLVLLGDILLFGQAFGINLFLFAIAVAGGALLSARTRPPRGISAVWIGLVAMAALPLVIGPSPMGIAIALVAVMTAALAASRLVPQRLTRLPLVLCRFLALAPRRLFDDARKHSVHRKTALPVRKAGAGLRVWIVPLALASVFLVLFAMANPVIDDILRSIDLDALWNLLDFWRVSFWFVIAIGIWALLRPRLLRLKKRAAIDRPTAPITDAIWLGHGSVLRSLIVFNAMFAVQTLLDLAYLWGGASLPVGMTNAQYAHRGAYPLLATALLAGAFVLVAMRRDGPGDRSPAIRALVHVWIAQNILLCLSAILRLDLYVEVYSLTELRVAAGIWMGLVAVGLALILLRILLRRSNEWLIAMNLASLTLVLYAAAFVDIPAAIARFNVEHSRQVSGEGVGLDLDYLASLGPSAIPALDRFIETVPEELRKTSRAVHYRTMLSRQFRSTPRDWRSWSLRSEKLADYLDANLSMSIDSTVGSFDDIQYRQQ